MELLAVIKDWFKSKDEIDFGNRRWRDYRKVIINPVHFKEITTQDGFTFPIDEEFVNWKDIFDTYRYDDIRPDDVVMVSLVQHGTDDVLIDIQYDPSRDAGTPIQSILPRPR